MTPVEPPVVERGPVDKTFRPFDPDQIFLVPPSLDEWLPQNHLARFIADLVDEHLDLSGFYADYKQGRGAPPFDPRLMVRVLLLGYTTSSASETGCTDGTLRPRPCSTRATCTSFEPEPSSSPHSPPRTTPQPSAQTTGSSVRCPLTPQQESDASADIDRADRRQSDTGGRGVFGRILPALGRQSRLKDRPAKSVRLRSPQRDPMADVVASVRPDACP